MTNAFAATAAEIARRPDPCCDLCVASAEGGAIDPANIKPATTTVHDADGSPMRLCADCAALSTPPTREP